METDVTYAWCGTSHEDQTSQISGPLVTQCASGVDQSTDTIGLDGTANEGRTPGRCSASGLFRLKELLLGVCGLSTLIGVTEDWGEDCERGGVVENGTKGNGRRLNRWEICKGISDQSSECFSMCRGKTEV